MINCQISYIDHSCYRERRQRSLQVWVVREVLSYCLASIVYMLAFSIPSPQLMLPANVCASLTLEYVTASYYSQTCIESSAVRRKTAVQHQQPRVLSSKNVMLQRLKVLQWCFILRKKQFKTYTQQFLWEVCSGASFQMRKNNLEKHR